ncbi:hypothetical protein HDU67_009563 [Dinochytrium kinnereticum]|nr:hypothetical protein HDU67_009563 [Dinochytrium kinnereticum]
MVSSPDPLSNIRKVKFTDLPATEPSSSREFRKMYLQAQDLHHRFWSANNEKFVRMKGEMEAKIMETHGRSATPMEFSQFYKEYLKASTQSHMEYNMSWWLLNSRMLVPAFKSEIMFALQGFFSVLDREGIRNFMWTLRREYRSLLRHTHNSYRAQGVSVR